MPEVTEATLLLWLGDSTREDNLLMPMQVLAQEGRVV
jgi:hypothetical protein